MKLISTALLVLSVLGVRTQDLSQHLWKNRLLVLSGDENLEPVQKQLQLLMQFPEELEERKFEIYLLSKDKAMKGFQKDIIKLDAQVFKRLSLKDNTAEMILIGLDGGVKKRFKIPVDPRAVFELVDRMPMRISEMRGH